MNYSTLIMWLSLISILGIFLVVAFSIIGIKCSYLEIDKSDKKSFVQLLVAIIISIVGLLTTGIRLLDIGNTQIGSFWEKNEYYSQYYADIENINKKTNQRVIANVHAWNFNDGGHIEHIYYVDKIFIDNYRYYNLNDAFIHSNSISLSCDTTYIDENDNEIYITITLTDKQVKD